MTIRAILEALAALRAAATRGPWRAEFITERKRGRVNWHWSVWGAFQVGRMTSLDVGADLPKADAAFIAASYNAMPALLAVAAAAEAETAAEQYLSGLGHASPDMLSDAERLLREARHRRSEMVAGLQDVEGLLLAYAPRDGQ